MVNNLSGALSVEMDKVMTAWWICFQVFVLHGLALCNLTSSITSLNDTLPILPKAPSDDEIRIFYQNMQEETTVEARRFYYVSLPTASLNSTLPILPMAPSEDEIQNFYQKMQEQTTDEARRFYYVSWPKEDRYALRFKQSTDQVYFLDYNVSGLCSKHIRHISEGIHRGDSWALAFLDSNGHTDTTEILNNVNILGSKEQCQRIMVKDNDQEWIAGKYINWDSVLPESDVTPFEMYLSWSFCVPKSCTDDDHVSMANTFLDAWGLFTSNMVYSNEVETPRDLWYWAAMVTLSTLAFICILATAIDCLYTFCLTQPSLEKHISTTEEEDEEQLLKENGVIKGKEFECRGSLRIMQSFSLSKNLSEILKTSSSEGDIGCIHGLRVLSIMWVICGHVSNSLPKLRDSNEWMYLSPGSFVIIAYSAPYAVDSFFLLSGCLVSYLFIKTVNKVGQLKPIHMVMYYIHRYIRLTPLYLIIIMIYAGVLPDFLASSLAPQYKDYCSKYWWRNILYINNLYEYNDICVEWSWYLSNDMQFYAIAPIVIVPIVYGFHKLGLLMASLMLICHIGATTYVLEVVRVSHRSKPFDYITEVYSKPWNRIGPYAIGLVLGFFLSVRKTDLKIKKTLLLIGWLSCAALSIGLVLADNYYAKKDATIEPNLSTVKLRVQEIVKRPLWGFCLAWLILACHFGYGGLLNNFLTWKAWIPLSKLTYGTYLCHKLVISFFDDTKEYGIELYYFLLFERLFYVTVLTYLMSLILSLLIEIPTRNLLKTFQRSSENVGHYRLVKKEEVTCQVKTDQ